METNTIEKNGITEGVIWKQLLAFFFPILFGTLFQTLYNTVDAIIVGQFLGKQALAAVGGGTGTMINLVIGFFMGLSSGATVVISQFYGAKDEEKTSKAVHTAIALAIVGGILVSILGFIFTRPLLKLTATPDDIMPMAETYLHIYFAGSLSIVMYNMCAGIFRAMGDSRHPLYFLIAGSIINIILDFILIAVFKMSVDGAAIATVISQIASALLSLVYLGRRTDSCKLRIKAIRFDSSILKIMMKIGFPAAIQSIMYNISNMIIQTRVNSFGTDSAAAWAAYGKLDAIFWMTVNAFGISITTFVGQNFGAGKIDRARKGVKSVFKMTLVTTVFMEVLYVLLGRFGYMIFLTDTAVIDIGMKILLTIAPFYFTYIAIELMSGAIRGAGKSLVPTLFTVVGICGLRILWLSIPALCRTIELVMLCYPVSWTIVSILFILYYCIGDIYGDKKVNKLMEFRKSVAKGNERLYPSP